MSTTISKGRALLPLKNCIRHWELTLFHDKYLMKPSTIVIIESTIAHLKTLLLYVQDKSDEIPTE